MKTLGYYNGIVFKGFVKGIFEEVLSGGQYDKLMKKMNRKIIYLYVTEQMWRKKGSSY